MEFQGPGANETFCATFAARGAKCVLKGFTSSKVSCSIQTSRTKQRRSKACWSFLRFACPGFHHPCRNSAHSMLQLKPLGQELLLQSNWVKHFYSIPRQISAAFGAQSCWCCRWAWCCASHHFFRGAPFPRWWGGKFPESITMTAFSMEPDSGESKSAPGESLDEELATLCFQGT